MAIHKRNFNTREFWLQHRQKRIGGSDAASLLGMDPWRDNVTLWRQKMGIEKAPDISEKAAVKYGTDAEQYLRGLFILDHPELSVEYENNNSWDNDEYPFAYASLDGWCKDERGQFGVIEFKTTTIKNPTQGKKWDNGIPDNYYCQVLHYMMVTDAKFAWLSALLRYEHDDGQLTENIRHYRLVRSDVESDIGILCAEEKKFYQYMVDGVEPPKTLPGI